MKTYTLAMNVCDLMQAGVEIPEFDNGVRYLFLSCSELPWEDRGTLSLTWIKCGLGDKMLLEMWCDENHVKYEITL